MALVWLPLDEATVDAMIVVARSSWEREDLDATWKAAGWPQPAGPPVSRQVFDKYEFILPADRRLVEIDLGRDLEAVRGFSVTFATFYQPEDPDDLDLDELISAGDAETGWRTDAAADRRRFDTEWGDACVTVAGRLGDPVLTGRHCTEQWHHAVWPVGERLLVVAQGEDFDSYSTYDDASIFVLAHDPDAPIPVGDKLYDRLCGQ
jgi:hypothetical protein